MSYPIVILSSPKNYWHPYEERMDEIKDKVIVITRKKDNEAFHYYACGIILGSFKNGHDVYWNVDIRECTPIGMIDEVPVCRHDFERTVEAIEYARKHKKPILVPKI